MPLKNKYQEISGWGLYPKIKVKNNKPKNISELKEAILYRPLVARGNGRSYGDCAINKSNTIDMTNFNRFLHFDDKTGLLVVQSGVLLKEVIDLFFPNNFIFIII